MNEYFKIIDTPNKLTSELLQECKAKFPVWSYYSDEELDRQFPLPKEETTRYFLKTVEADEKHSGKSANDCENEGVQGMTLRERIIMELQYFEETGKHLDIIGWTSCIGSRSSDGIIPFAGWIGVKFRIDWCSVDNRNDGLRLRKVQFPIPQSSAIPLSLAIETVKKAGYVLTKKSWFITGQGLVMELTPDSDKSDNRRKFLGSYATKEEAQKVVEEIKNKYGDK